MFLKYASQRPLSLFHSINERVPRLANWIETRFSVKATSAKADVLEAFFLCLRDKQPLVLKVHPVNNQIQVCKLFLPSTYQDISIITNRP